MEISDNSHLNIFNTCITNNFVYGESGLINVRSNSSLTLMHILYKENTISNHLSIVNNSNIIIKDCAFFQNIVKRSTEGDKTGLLVTDTSLVVIISSQFTSINAEMGNTHIFSIKRSEMTLNGITFSKNSHPTHPINENSLIFTQSSKEINLVNSVFNNNEADYILYAKTNRTTKDSYLQIDNCYFDNDENVNFHTEYINDIIIRNALFENGLEINNADSVRLWNSTFNIPYGWLPFSFDCALSFHHTMELFTLNSSFTDGKIILKTNNTDFWNQAESAGFISTGMLLKIVHQETNYTSSKYYHQFFLKLT